MRCRIQLSYVGTRFAGWQKQPGDISIQQTLEESFSTVLREQIEITGCGRTDAGVHARDYTAHCDVIADRVDLEKIVYQVNAILPPDIAVQRLSIVREDFHARYDAVERSYRYAIHFVKDPFLHNRSLFLSSISRPDPDIMQEAAALLMKFNQFKPFCKTGSDNKNYQCTLNTSSWEFEDNACYYQVSANRFLRGMVRLIVGACLNAGHGKLKLEDISKCMEDQEPLPVQLSVPAHGLYFQYAKYRPD